MRILIADDEPLIAEGLCRLLGLLGHQVTVAGDSAATLQQLKTDRPDLLLLDWLMPHGGGQRVVQQIFSGEVRSTQVVLMTGTPGDHLPPLINGLPILCKPFRLQDLKELLDSLPMHSPIPS